jgi:hypothetical protein
MVATTMGFTVDTFKNGREHFDFLTRDEQAHL